MAVKHSTTQGSPLPPLTAPAPAAPEQPPQEAQPGSSISFGDHLSLYIWGGGVVIISVLLLKELLVGFLPR